MAPARPFTVEHFAIYASVAILDNGEPFELESFQRDIAADIFAGFTEVWLVIPEGNGKTTFLALLALYYGDYTPSAMIPIAASSREQAEIMYSQASGLVARSPELKARFRAYDGYRRIKCLRTTGRIQVFAADDRTGDGIIPGGLALIDELHRHRDLKLYRTWRGKLGKRNAQLVTISTAGEPNTEFEDARNRALAQALEVRREGFHTRAAGEDSVVHDFAVPEGEDVDDMEVVKLANPLTGITPQTLEKKRRSPAMTLTHWQRFVCNQAVRIDETAIDPREWSALGTDEEIPRGEMVDVGVDLGWKHDTTAIVPLWTPEPQRRLVGAPEILVPPRDGQSLAPELIREAFERIHARNPIRYAVMDPDRGAEIATWLEEDLGVQVVEHLQTHVPMTLAYERLMEAIRNQWLHHPRHRELTEHVLNAIARTLPDGRARFDRPSSTRAQAGQRRRVIDGLVALAMVHSVATSAVEEPEPLVVWG